MLQHVIVANDPCEKCSEGSRDIVAREKFDYVKMGKKYNKQRIRNCLY